MRQRKGGRRGAAADEPTVATDDEIDEASEDSFPASDAPGWSGMRIGPPTLVDPPHREAPRLKTAPLIRGRSPSADDCADLAR
jgi:hypothetical protein